jgi:mono/diheme cytochrome c family protein
MDCITCHNRTAHKVYDPQATMDNLLARNLVSPELPNIRKIGADLLSASYNSWQEAFDAIDGLRATYQQDYPDFYNKSQNQDLVLSAVQAIQTAYQQNHFPDQKVDWNTHPENAGHKDSPGCFRCHDGKHLNAKNEAIRLECNLCHSIPVVSDPEKLVTNLSLEKGLEPDSHKNPNWIALHRSTFDNTCQSCHTTDDPGGTSNTSFCSNSACHGSSWTFAGFDAPKLREILGQPASGAVPTPQVEPTSSAGQPTAAAPSGPVTYEQVSGFFTAKCSACHGANGSAGLDLSSYAGIMAGSSSGPVVVPGDAEGSLLVQVQEGQHFGKLSADELALVKQWIEEGAKEK